VPLWIRPQIQAVLRTVTYPVSRFAPLRTDGYSVGMSMSVEELEDAVRGLTAQQRAAFRAWYAEFDAEEWDRQLESDVKAGRLDWLINEAREERRAGRFTDR